MKFITVCTHSDGYLPFLQQSFDRYNTKLQLLGFGEKWAGFNWKFHKTMEYLQGLPEDEVVCFIDGYDVMLLKDPKDMEKEFLDFCQQTGKKVVVGCDIPDTIDFQFVRYITFDKCQDKLLNSGTYIGKTKDIIYMLNSIRQISTKPTEDDQVLLTKWCRKNEDWIHIDCDSKFFLTVSKYPFLSINPDVLKTNAYLLHCPGNTYMNNVIIKLGYEISDEEEQRIKKFHRQIIIKKLKHFITFPIFIFIFLLLLILSIFLILRNNK